jgi:hypothetical protein
MSVHSLLQLQICMLQMETVSSLVGVLSSAVVLMYNLQCVFFTWIKVRFHVCLFIPITSTYSGHLQSGSSTCITRVCSLTLYSISFATCTYGNTSINIEMIFNFDLVFLINVVLDKLKLVSRI